MENQNPFDGMKTVKSNFIKFSKVGDWAKGTFLGKRVVPSQLNPGKMQALYDIKLHGASFHATDENKQVVEPPITPDAGTYWTVSGKKAIDDAMRNIQEGQIVGFRFVKTNPPKVKGYNPTKVIEVLEGAMDPEFMGEGTDDIDPETAMQ